MNNTFFSKNWQNFDKYNHKDDDENDKLKVDIDNYNHIQYKKRSVFISDFYKTMNKQANLEK